MDTEVCVTGKKLDAAGVLVDFGELKAHVADIMKALDHQFLNEQMIFDDDFPPSSENIAIYITQCLQKKIDRPGIRVSRVSTWESDTSCATYINED